MAKFSFNKSTDKHSVSNLSWEDMRRIILSLPQSSKLRLDMHNHLVSSVTEEQLEGLEYNAQTYVDNFLG